MKHARKMVLVPFTELPIGENAAERKLFSNTMLTKTLVDPKLDATSKFQKYRHHLIRKIATTKNDSKPEDVAIDKVTEVLKEIKEESKKTNQLLSKEKIQERLLEKVKQENLNITQIKDEDVTSLFKDEEQTNNYTPYNNKIMNWSYDQTDPNTPISNSTILNSQIKSILKKPPKLPEIEDLTENEDESVRQTAELANDTILEQPNFIDESKVTKRRRKTLPVKLNDSKLIPSLQQDLQDDAKITRRKSLPNDNLVRKVSSQTDDNKSWREQSFHQKKLLKQLNFDKNRNLDNQLVEINNLSENNPVKTKKSVKKTSQKLNASQVIAASKRLNTLRPNLQREDKKQKLKQKRSDLLNNLELDRLNTEDKIVDLVYKQQTIEPDLVEHSKKLASDIKKLEDHQKGEGLKWLTRRYF